MDRPYSVLGVEPGADDDAVRAAYRTLMKDHHPDHGGSTEEFIRIKEAYETIQRDDASARDARSGADGRPRRSTDGGTTTRTGSASTGVEVTEHRSATAVSCSCGVGLELRGEYLTLRLVALVEEQDLSELVAAHMLDGTVERTVAYLAVENTGDRTVRWRGNQCLRFVGSDGYTYESAGEYCASEPKLPPRWKGSDVAVEPGTRMNAVVVAEELPDDVEVSELAYTQNVFARRGAGSGIEDKERFRFEVGSSVKHHLARAPF